MKNILTVDVEDWHHAFLNIPPDTWDCYESRIEYSTHRILHILDRAGAKATFFILGRVAADYPELIRKIRSEGHEIGSHGYSHQPIYQQTARAFRKDLRKSLDILEKITGEPVTAYRAPWFSITGKSLWALDILSEEGIRYDASIFPVQNPFYGIRGAGRSPYIIAGKYGSLLELPPATLGTGHFVLPTGGGFYLRTLPYPLIRRSIRNMNRKNIPAVMYVHPWELDTAPPHIRTDISQMLIHYANIGNAEQRFRRLLSDFQFVSIKERFADKARQS